MDLKTLLSQVRERESEGDLVTAHRLLDRADKPLRKAGAYHYARGALAFRLGDVMKAVESFREAVRLEPEFAEYWANLGAALFEHARRTGGLEPRGDDAPIAADLQEAKDALERACALSPKLPNAANNLGLVLATLGDAEGALEAFARALALDPDDVPTRYNQAAALAQLERDEECLAALDELLKRAPDFAPARASRERVARRRAK